MSKGFKNSLEFTLSVTAGTVLIIALAVAHVL
jgi:hypothetical protein